MAMMDATKRLRKEYQNINRDPPPNIIARPNMANILEWHYVIFGPKGSVYEGGVYHGKIKFPQEYPHKPPSILMITPSGRFQINTRLCLSMSDFHPETWNPMWSVSSILTGLLSFMLETKETHGSISTSEADKRKLARYSKTWNAKNPLFKKHFPELTESSNITTPETPSNQTTPCVIQGQEHNTTEPVPAHPPQTGNTKTPNGPYQANFFVVVLAIIIAVALFNHFL